MKKITAIEGLAEFIHETMASKEDIKALEARVSVRLDGIDVRLDRIEHLLLAEQKREIEDLKTRLKRLENTRAVSSRLRSFCRHATPTLRHLYFLILIFYDHLVDSS